MNMIEEMKDRAHIVNIISTAIEFLEAGFHEKNNDFYDNFKNLIMDDRIPYNQLFALGYMVEKSVIDAEMVKNIIGEKQSLEWNLTFLNALFQGFFIPYQDYKKGE